MIIAQQKKRENIVEYILYMWQVEDMIRALDFDMEKIEEYIISKFDVKEDTREAMRFWYESLIETMKNEKVEEKGHIQVLQGVVKDLNDLHIRLMRSPFHQDYQQVFNKTMPFLAEFFNKSEKKKENKSVIEIALEFMYGIWMLKLKKQPISQGTQEAANQISDFLSLLALKYHQLETDEDFSI